MDSTTAEILILGSSRAYHHYVPKVLEDSLNMTCFNTGRDGQFLFYSYAIFFSALRRYNPKIIIFDINQSDFYGSYDFDKLSFLLPYYKGNPELRTIIELRGPLEKYKHISKIYPFNSRILSIINGNIGLIDLKNKELKGYGPLFGQLSDSSLVQKHDTTLEVNQIAIDLFDKIVSICKLNNIRLIMIRSPRYELSDRTKSNGLFQKLMNGKNIEFWDYVGDTAFLKSKLFKDRSHLNDLGAHTFTRTIALRLKSPSPAGVTYCNSQAPK